MKHSVIKIQDNNKNRDGKYIAAYVNQWKNAFPNLMTTPNLMNISCNSILTQSNEITS